MSVLIPNETVAIGIGAVCGAISRYQVGRVCGEWIAKDPNLNHMSGWHTALINIGGSFILGGVSVAPSPNSKKTPEAGKPRTFGLSPKARLLMGVGFCGSFTTFSTYSVDIAGWLAQGKTAKALSYVMVNNVGGVVAAAAGMALVKKLFA